MNFLHFPWSFCTYYSLFLGVHIHTHSFPAHFYLFIRFKVTFFGKLSLLTPPTQKVRIKCPSSVLLCSFLFIMLILVYFSVSLCNVSSFRLGPVFCALSFRCSANNCWKGCRSLDFTRVSSSWLGFSPYQCDKDYWLKLVFCLLLGLAMFPCTSTTGGTFLDKVRFFCDSDIWGASVLLIIQVWVIRKILL